MSSQFAHSIPSIMFFAFPSHPIPLNSPSLFCLLLFSFWFLLTHAVIFTTKHLCYLVMNVQSCCILSSRWIPCVGSLVTGRPLCCQCNAVILSTKEAVQWKGSLSPLNTTCLREGNKDSVCSSSGPSREQDKTKVNGNLTGIDFMVLKTLWFESICLNVGN